MTEVGRIHFAGWPFGKNPDKDNPTMQFECYIGSEGIRVSDGYGGWEIINRPRRVGVTQWGGRSPLMMEVPLLFDGFKARNDVDLEMDILKKMSTGHYPADGPNDPPPIVKVDGPSVPHSEQQWVVSGLTWGEKIIANNDGRTLRQEAGIVVMRYHEIDKLQLKAASLARKKTVKPPKPPKKTKK